MEEKANEKDDLELVADDLDKLNEHLKTRTIWIPRRPNRFLDPAALTKEQLLERIRQDAEEFTRTPFVPWILELDGKKRLPVFSNKQRMQQFMRAISKNMNKVFSLGGAEALLGDVTKELNIDFVDLNLFCEKSWEIGIRPRKANST